jgi:hypothetical protein
LRVDSEAVAWEYWGTQSEEHIMIVATAITAALLVGPQPGVGELPACKYDDGSGSRSVACVWDARHMGNGEGKSFVAIKINKERLIVRVSHKVAHALAN